jgi:preprotein translocase subunit SecY
VIGNLGNLLRVPEIRQRILVTLGFLLVYRLGWSIPIPGVDLVVLSDFFASTEGDEGNAFTALFGMISGGGVYSCAIFSLGIMPYISSSIIFSLLTKVVPSLEAVAKEGAAGQRRINQWTRLATVPLAMLQAVILVANVYRQPEFNGQPILPPGFGMALTAILALTAGTIALMWIGEQITEYGVGNGISLLIMAGIIARVPNEVMRLIDKSEGGFLPFALLGLFLLIVVAVVFITKGTRKITVQYAKLTRGRRQYGGQKHFLPLKVNQAGVMPVIFASALLSFPQLMAQALGWKTIENAFLPSAWWYTFLNIVLIYFFSFFWNSLMFNPSEMSKNMKDAGSFIPGIRPGRSTAEFLEKVMTRITLAGATFLALIAILPQQMASWISREIPLQVAYFLGGTSILIVVSVALDLVDKLNSALLMRNQRGFMD